MKQIEPHPHAAARRAERVEAANAIGIDAVLISQLVETFYAKVRSDVVLAPIFATRIADWPVHLERMKRFWGSVLLGDGGYAGNPMVKHAAIPGIERGEFQRWLLLFGETLDDLDCPDAARAQIGARARSIADSLLTGIRIHRDRRTDLNAMKGLDHA